MKNQEETVRILSRTPPTLNALLMALPEEWTTSNEGEGTWSPFDVVGHLLHGERTDWIPRAKIILAQGEDRKFETFDRFAQIEANKGKSMDDLLRTFAAVREENLAVLRGFDLTDDQMGLTGEHPQLGTVTLGQLLATWVAHDLGHIAQIARVMAKQYSLEVGPWKEFIPVLDA